MERAGQKDEGKSMKEKKKKITSWRKKWTKLLPERLGVFLVLLLLIKKPRLQNKKDKGNPPYNNNTDFKATSKVNCFNNPLFMAF